uniref:LPXTG-motif cell wall anchor domain protein n=1 Tax=Bionectria ochroleuca TaxID=29856 RepID=A0A0B7JK39_BIOOC
MDLLTLQQQSRVFRSHRRPLSTTVAAYQPDSPPRIPRRLSDQEQSSSRRMDDAVSEIARTLTQRSMSRDKAMSAHPAAMDDAVSDFARTLTQRSMSRDKAMSAHPLDDAVTEIARNLTQRSMSRDKAMSAHPLEDSYHRSRHSGSALRPSPLTPRSTTLPDSLTDNPIHTRRRSSITDQNTTPPTRSTTYRSSGSTVQVHGKTYHSSPLVRSFDLIANRNAEPAQAVEGTESTASTTAPSTVWDELDDLKSRMRRLELTGKLPPTSGAAVSRLTDERPPTATTTVTTVSSSPKRVVVASQANDAASAVATAQHESFPVLHSALAKSKPFLNPEIYRALETAATEAMSLSSMMGTSGQPGPISSGASGIGTGSNITDRQLRRKADSVCRSLTELCVALGEDVAHSRPPQVSHSHKSSLSKPQVQQAPQIAQEEGPRTPTINKSFNTMTSLSSQKRPSMAAEGSASKPPSTVTSPSRALSKFEERRNTLLNANTLPSPRATGSGPPTPQDANANRRSSLLVARSRRALTEEPEEVTGRRSSLLLRSRRGATEEPEEGRQTEGRQTSLLYRSRRGTAGEGDDEARFTTPSRAYTEVNSSRGPGREYTEVATSSRLPTRDFNSQSQLSPQDASHTSALPRRRFMSGTTGISRLATPAAPTTTTLPTRKYVERSTHERRDSVGAERTERSQKRYSLGSNAVLTSGVSLGSRRQNRDSTIPNITTTTAAGNYR